MSMLLNWSPGDQALEFFADRLCWGSASCRPRRGSSPGPGKEPSGPTSRAPLGAFRLPGGSCAGSRVQPAGIHDSFDSAPPATAVMAGLVSGCVWMPAPGSASAAGGGCPGGV